MKYYIQGFLITMGLYLLIFGMLYLIKIYPTELIAVMWIVLGIIVTVFFTYAFSQILQGKNNIGE